MAVGRCDRNDTAVVSTIRWPILHDAVFNGSQWRRMARGVTMQSLDTIDKNY